MANRRGILSFFKKDKKVSQSFLVNGGLLLEELIKTSNGRCRIPIQNFSVKDLLTATNNFDEHNLFRERMHGFYEMYKGSIDGRLIVVKKFNDGEIYKAIRNIAITAQMCIHKNVLKPVGCCLEDGSIAMVYEHVKGRFLHDCIKDGVGPDNKSLSWKCRLRAANEIASVIAYLHTALDRPVVHRIIIPENFMIDQHGVVKLCDFSYSISIPLGELRVKDDVFGIWGFIDPEYLDSGFVTEKCDVYSFGVLLLILLTGQNPLERNEEYSGNDPVDLVQSYFENYDNNQINEIVDPKILRGGTNEQELQFHAFAVLALRCTEERSDERPDMIEVAKELRRIERSIPQQVTPP